MSEQIPPRADGLEARRQTVVESRVHWAIVFGIYEESQPSSLEEAERELDEMNAGRDQHSTMICFSA